MWGGSRPDEARHGSSVPSVSVSKDLHFNNVGFVRLFDIEVTVKGTGRGEGAADVRPSVSI